jgi:hypothetical protein
MTSPRPNRSAKLLALHKNNWLHRAWAERLAGLTIPLVLTPVAIISLFLGEDVSRAFTNVGGGAVIRVLAAAMLLGGVSALWGVWRNDPLWEVVGLVFIALGCAIYVVGDFLGLGMLGLLAAAGHICVILTLLGRVHQITTAGKVHERLNRLA